MLEAMLTARQYDQLALKTGTGGLRLPLLAVCPTKHVRPPAAAGGTAVVQAIVAGEGVGRGDETRCKQVLTRVGALQLLVAQTIGEV